MREIVLDTETTGLDPLAGHRIVEIGCIELVNRFPTGQTYHTYINPERNMPDEAFRVHGLSSEFLSKHPVFAEVAADFEAFIGDAKLVIHNAAFDLGFINAELAKLDRDPVDSRRAIDTVLIARQKFPSASVSLDALCRRFDIDNSARTKHGALLDAELLSDVYLELIGARQTTLEFGQTTQKEMPTVSATRIDRTARAHQPTEKEREAHDAFVERLANPIWRSA